MAKFGSTADMIQAFANRFEPAGDGYLYRANLRRPGIRVSAQERDQFVDDYTRAAKALRWETTAAMVLAIGLIVGLDMGYGVDVGDWTSYGILSLAVAIVLGRVFWAAYAPNRELAYRSPVDQGRSAADARRISLQRMTWRRLGGLAVLMVLISVRVAWGTDVTHGWHRLWLVAGAAVVGLFAWTAYRKWRVERADTGPTKSR